jgi:hypothetical protein
LWGNCAASLIATDGRPDLPNRRTIEGSGAHWVGAECLLAWVDPDGGAPICRDWLYKVDPDGTVIDEEMCDGAQVHVDNVLKVCNDTGGLRSLLVEHAVTMSNIHPGNAGTLDAALFDKKGAKLYLWDYKHGRRGVDVVGNLQFVDYVEGLIEKYEIDGVADQYIEVVIRCVQPFNYSAFGPVKEWRLPLHELRGYFNRLKAKADEATGPNPTYTTGKHCRDCTALLDCEAGRQAHYNFIDLVDTPTDLSTMDGASLALFRNQVRDGQAVGKSLATAIDEELTHRIREGARDTGLALESKLGNLAWTVDDAKAIAIAAQFGVNNAKAVAALTPTQTKNATPTALRPAMDLVLKSVTKRPPGGLTLTQAGDTIAARAFAKKEV